MKIKPFLSNNRFSWNKKKNVSFRQKCKFFAANEQCDEEEMDKIFGSRWKMTLSEDIKKMNWESVPIDYDYEYERLKRINFFKKYPMPKQNEIVKKERDLYK